MTKRRITVPEDQIAVLLPRELAEDLQSLLIIVRRRAPRIAGKDAEPLSVHKVAGDVLLALMEAEL